MSKVRNKKYAVPSDYKIQRLYRKRAKIKRKLNIEMFGLVVFIVIEMIIIGVFLFASKTNSLVSLEDTEKFTIKADSVEYKTLVPSERKASDNKLYIVYGSKEYLYQDLLYDHYEGDSLAEDLKNDILTITVEKDTERVVDLRGEKTVFYTIDDFNKTARSRNIMGIIILAVIELIFFAALFIYLHFVKLSWNEVKKINEKINNTKDSSALSD